MRVVPVSNIQYMHAFNGQNAEKAAVKSVSVSYNPSFGGFYRDYIYANKIDYANNPKEHETDKKLGLQIEKLNRIINTIQARIDNPKYADKKELLTDKLEKYNELKEHYVNELVLRHLAFTLKYVNSCNIFEVPYDDLYSYAAIGLKKAAEKWSPTTYPGVHFIDYAKYWVKAIVYKNVMKNHPISMSPGVVSHYYKILNTQEELEKKLNRKPTDSEVAKELNIPVKKYLNFINNMKYTVVSLDEPVKTRLGENMNLSEVVEDSYGLEQAENRLLKEDLAYMKKLMDSPVLEERERAIIKDRYRFTDGKNDEPVKLISLETIARKYNLTYERIRQIEKEALEKLRNAYMG